MSAIAMLTEDQAWAAILSRDPAADAELVYAVTTTGVFCRPTCPSRRPSRDNVRFFADARSAASAGFRPCRRCRPTQQHSDAALVASLSARLKSERPATLGELARLTGRSPFTLSRLFKRVLGVTPAQYQRQQRAASFRRELAHGSARVTDAVYDAGFSGPGRAYETTQLGMAPGAYRAGAPNARIGYATAPCPLGRILIAATERGLCSVILGANDDYLLRELRQQFPAAKIAAEPALDAMLAQVLTQFTDHPATLDLPLDLRATAFQMRVWEALRRIPRGETRTYSQIANALGHPKAVRAVGRACATNQVAVVIPCHRAIGSNGSLTGYRWGIERKEKLLALEKSAPAAQKSARS
jgi:AraC family transcriptional regulator, regulatory protein of adaptative response / methylated-DNA-[protein]-cysteine methyltransferase